MESSIELTEKQKALLEKLPEDIKKYSYVVGKWIWLRFPDKPAANILKQVKELDFKWNNERKVWQNRCGCYVFNRAPYDPREKYGCQSILENSLMN